MPNAVSTLKVECSFCGTKEAGDKAKSHYVAGPTVFVCRDCVDMMVDIFSQNDHQWADKKVRDIAEIRSKPEIKR
jgi:ATP-dependent protease Clp ATPase subunit